MVSPVFFVRMWIEKIKDSAVPGFQTNRGNRIANLLQHILDRFIHFLEIREQFSQFIVCFAALAVLAGALNVVVTGSFNNFLSHEHDAAVRTVRAGG